MAAVAHPTRPLGRRNSPLSVFSGSNGILADTSMMRRIDVGDDSDSDDEPPPAIKFSKVTQALLDDASAPSSLSKQNQQEDALRRSYSTNADRVGLDTPSRAAALRIVRRSSPQAPGSQGVLERGSTPPRVVHLGTKGTSSTKRSVSIAGPYSQRNTGRREPTPETGTNQEMTTPAPAPRAIRLTRSGSRNFPWQDGPASGALSVSRPGSRNGKSGADTGERKTGGEELSRSTSFHQVSDPRSRFGTSTTARSRNTSADTAPGPGSQRIKRAPIGTGSFLKSGPVRRGFRRRESEENVSPNDEWQGGAASHANDGSFTPQERSTVHTDDVRSRSGSVNGRATSVEPVSVQDFAAQHQNQSHGSRPSSRQGNSHLSRSQMSNDSRPPSRQANYDLSRSRQQSVERNQPQRRLSTQQTDVSKPSEPQPQRRPTSRDGSQAKLGLDQGGPQRVPSLGRNTYRYTAPKLPPGALEDQENVPPPTFRRNKDQEFKYLGNPTVAIVSDDGKPKSKIADETPVPVPYQEQRKVLGAITGNTPLRPAPAPPPKMTVLDTATTTGGASTTKARKKRQHMVVNGKIFTQMGKIGKGGSSDVYCVMAENYKTFALKRVKLDDCDENAVRGYKGEIDLLKQLTEVDRVVRLFDWELSEEKQELVVLMEKGDTDLNRILTLRLNGSDAQFDPTFTRYQWKEMLECVEAVHDHDIVHSDLKPANFLLVQGRLKLIDFGIANAIDIDNTCNVHRDSHVGTPNYMSPESITDTNASHPGKDAAGRPMKKDMRIGKSSDVWSLGCILYQMAYGRPPFAHIANQISRIMAITNPKHVIEFPEIGVGGEPIPPVLRSLLRRCLNRDADQRPTIKQLLDKSDAYLYPDRGGGSAGTVPMSEELLGQIITKVVDRCRDPKRGIPTPDEIHQYPASFMAKIREMQER